MKTRVVHQPKGQILLTQDESSRSICVTDIQPQFRSTIVLNIKKRIICTFDLFYCAEYEGEVYFLLILSESCRFICFPNRKISVRRGFIKKTT